MEDAPAGVHGEAGGQVVELPADRFRFCGGEFELVAQEEDPGPGTDIGDEGRGQHPGNGQLLKKSSHSASLR